MATRKWLLVFSPGFALESGYCADSAKPGKKQAILLAGYTKMGDSLSSSVF